MWFLLKLKTQYLEFMCVHDSLFTIKGSKPLVLFLEINPTLPYTHTHTHKLAINHVCSFSVHMSNGTLYL